MRPCPDVLRKWALSATRIPSITNVQLRAPRSVCFATFRALIGRPTPPDNGGLSGLVPIPYRAGNRRLDSEIRNHAETTI